MDFMNAPIVISLSFITYGTCAGLLADGLHKQRENQTAKVR